MKIADVSIRRPVFAAMMMAALLVFGLVAYPRIGVDLFPNVEFPFVTVTVVYPGADPASMESKVADPLEEAINTLSGIEVLRSVNLESVTQVMVQFSLDVDVDRAVQEVRDRVSSVQRQLPAGTEPPVVDKFDIGAAPIMSLALSGDLPVKELTKIAEDVVKDRVQRLQGVGAVDLVGARQREIHVEVDPAKLSGLSLTVDDVAGALRAQNIEIPAGRVEAYPRELTVKTKGEVRSLDEIRDIIIPGAPGTVRIRDVAQVIDGAEEARSWSSMNGKAALALVVRKQSGANAVAIAKKVKAELAALQPTLVQRGATLSIPSDTTPYIEHSINDVKFDLLFGGILAVVIILFFLHDLRATFISALALPISVVATFAFIQVMGFTFNNMTMLGLSLSIGILIDDAIVVIENIHRHLELGKPPMVAAREASTEIGLAVLATTFSLVAVFVPVAVMEGIVGRFFFQFGMTVSFAVLISLFVSFSLTPMLSSRLLSQSHGQPNALVRGIERTLGAVDRGYRHLLGSALRHRAITLIIAAGALFGSCALVTRVPTEFISPEDRGEFSINIELPSGTGLAASQAYIETVAADVRAHGPSVVETFVTLGAGAQGQVNVGKIQVKLSPRAQRPFRQQQVMAWCRTRYGSLPGSLVTVGEISPVGGDSGFRQQPIQFNIRGSNMDELTAAAAALSDELGKVPGFVDLDTSYRGGKPEIAINIDRDRAASLGVPVAAIASTIRAYVAGDKVTDFKDGLDLYDVTVELSQAAKQGLAGLDNLAVRSQRGTLVDLANVVTVAEGEGPSQIERQARQRQITVFANLDGMSLGNATKIVDARAAAVVPKSLTTDYEGTAKMMKESFQAMLLALFLAVIIVYMILAAQFNSFLHPFTIMLSLPLSVVGAFGALYLSGMTLNIFSMIGVIMLMGLVTKNAILLVDYTNVLRERGMGVTEALLEAGPVRLRPILMTTFAMIFGMLPVALAISEGGETRAPMAVAVIGGLITSTLLTLVIVPIAYTLAEGFRSSRPARSVRRLFGGNGVPRARATDNSVGRAQD
jgi:hydrophobic/amphiphilic exporter-1 (mainly G- bacteria), HAE1 family